MRTSTKRKTYGRTNMAQALRSAVADLDRAIEAFDVYSIERKRLRAALVKQKTALQELFIEVAELPITQEEKTIAKHNTTKQVHPEVKK